jgi:hypothetical protein
MSRDDAYSMIIYLIDSLCESGDGSNDDSDMARPAMHHGPIT